MTEVTNNGGVTMSHTRSLNMMTTVRVTRSGEDGVHGDGQMTASAPTVMPMAAGTKMEIRNEWD